MATKAIPYAQFTAKLMRRYENMRQPTTVQRMRLVSTIVGEMSDQSTSAPKKGRKKPAGPFVKTTAQLNDDMVQLFIETRRNGIHDPADPTGKRYLRKPVKQNTIIGELAYLKALCNYAVEHDFLARCPFKPKERLLRPMPLVHKTHLTRDEAADLLDHLSKDVFNWHGHRLYALTAFYLYTGVRKCEALYGMVEDLDLAEKIFYVQDRDENLLKTEGSCAPIGLPPELVPILESWSKRCASKWLFPGLKGNGPWVSGSIGYRPLDKIQAAAKAVGLEGVTIQSFRHTWKTNCRWWGISSDEAQEQLRHSDIRTQKHYDHEDLKRKAHAVKNVSFKRTG